MSSRHFLILFVALLISAVSGGRGGAQLGGWKPITDLKDPHVRDIAKFAVDTYNKQSKTVLEFESVIKGETQVVSGLNYRLVVAAKDGAASNNYEAVVWEKAWVGYRNLTSFRRI